MEEKKNANQPPEIKDEELDQVTGGLDVRGPMVPKVDFSPDLDHEPEDAMHRKTDPCPYPKTDAQTEQQIF